VGKGEKIQTLKSTGWGGLVPPGIRIKFLIKVRLPTTRQRGARRTLGGWTSRKTTAGGGVVNECQDGGDVVLNNRAQQVRRVTGSGKTSGDKGASSVNVGLNIEITSS